MKTFKENEVMEKSYREIDAIVVCVSLWWWQIWKKRPDLIDI
jgi:hypothetical protein